MTIARSQEEPSLVYRDVWTCGHVENFKSEHSQPSIATSLYQWKRRGLGRSRNQSLGCPDMTSLLQMFKQSHLVVPLPTIGRSALELLHPQKSLTACVSAPICCSFAAMKTFFSMHPSFLAYQACQTPGQLLNRLLVHHEPPRCEFQQWLPFAAAASALPSPSASIGLLYSYSLVVSSSRTILLMPYPIEHIASLLPTLAELRDKQPLKGSHGTVWALRSTLPPSEQ